MWPRFPTIQNPSTKMKQLLLSLSLTTFLLLLIKNGSSVRIVETLPGFTGRLPFKLETGYIGVGENEEIQLFYYFIESERDPDTDPLVIWLTGGPGCSGFSGLVYEIGPVTIFRNGSMPPFLELRSYSWTKAASIIFIDSPVRTGFSYFTRQIDYRLSDSDTTAKNYEFLRKWLLRHERFIKNPFFVSGDSYGGKMAALLALRIAQGIEDELEPKILFQGLTAGNPVTNVQKNKNEEIRFAHRLGLISDEYYHTAQKMCKGEYLNPDPDNTLCIEAVDVINTCLDGLFQNQVLEPKCSDPVILTESEDISSGLDDGRGRNGDDDEFCRDNWYLGSVEWANNRDVQNSLGVIEESVTKWNRCVDLDDFFYDKDVQSAVGHLKLIIEKGYDILLYSGDHDLFIPYTATLNDVRDLNLTLQENWRPWMVGHQIAGYTEKYKSHKAYLTFATVKGAGHTAPEYKRKECLEMFRRFTNKIPL